MRRIVEYEIENIGADHSQYFQGRGVSLTRWHEVSVGVGDNAKAAYDDAVEMLAQSGEFDVSTLPTRPRGIRQTDALTKEERENEEYNWRVAVYVRGAEVRVDGRTSKQQNALDRWARRQDSRG